MAALARRLRVVPDPAPMPQPEPAPDPEASARASRMNPVWPRLARPSFPADNVALAFWLSRCPPDLRRVFQLTDLRELARAIRKSI